MEHCTVNLRLAAGEIQAVEAHREIFAEHVTIPLCPLGRVVRKLQLTAIWTPQTLTLNCVNKAGTGQGLMQCPIKGDTPYFTAVQLWMLRRALQLQRKGQIINVGDDKQEWLTLLHLIAAHRPAHLQRGLYHHSDPGWGT